MREPAKASPQKLAFSWYQYVGLCDSNNYYYKGFYTVRYIAAISPHAETITCHFDGDKLDAEVDYSFNCGTRTIKLQGDAVKQ
jgi:hypothetical protein